MNHKNNARAKLFSMPVSPLAKDNVKENGHTSKNRKHFNENDETTAEESDMTNKDEDSDENNPAEPVITLMPYCICAKRPKLSDCREIGRTKTLRTTQILSFLIFRMYKNIPFRKFKILLYFSGYIVTYVEVDRMSQTRLRQKVP